MRSSDSERRDAARQLRGMVEAIGARSIEAMYRDPFWAARFGDRGRRFAEEDGRRHVQYLAEAIETAHDAPFMAYARWLRSVLTTRGMCSLHIYDNFARLADALREEDDTLFAAADPYLAAGARALIPADADAAELHRAALLVGGTGAVPFLDQPRFLLSYLADALDAGSVDSLATHVEWLAAEADRRGAAAAARLAATVERVCIEAAATPRAVALLAAAGLRLRS